MTPLDAATIKAKARALGADLVGIASAQRMNENPPDPRWPQTPGRLWSECRSVVVFAKRMPWGAFRSQDMVVKRTAPHHIMNRLDDMALDLTCFLEDNGVRAVPVPQQVTDTALKRGSYGPLSLRHAAVEAGLGTLGLNMMLVTPQFGPRVYVGAVLTDAELPADGPPPEAYCLGPQCGRCLLACPPDAIRHWGLNKAACSTNAQNAGISAFMGYLDRVLAAPSDEERFQLVHSMETVDLWQALRCGPGSYAACPRCFESCPVGEDYRAQIQEPHRHIPEATPEKRQRLQEMVAAEREDDHGLLDHSRRWVGRTRLGGDGAGCPDDGAGPDGGAG